MKALIITFATLLASSSAFAAKPAVSCSLEAETAATAVFGHDKPDGSDAMARYTAVRGSRIYYVVDFVSQISDGASTDEFVDATFKVITEIVSGQCQIVSVTKT